jgi:cyanophycin synthetase
MFLNEEDKNNKMKIISFRAFEGRNIYSHKKCIRMDVDLEGYSEIPSRDIEGFNESLIQLLPKLKEHRCGIDEPEGFVKRLREGTYLAHICEHIIIAIQNMMDIEVAYGKSREISGDKYYIIYAYEYKETAVKIGRLAVEIINSLINKKNIKFDNKIEEIKQILDREYIGTSTGALCNEAKNMGIPVIKIQDTGLYQFGYGKYSKYIEATICEDTGAVAVDISCDKMVTKAILKLQCLPIAEGMKVNSAIEVLIGAKKIGYPVVLKPQCGHQGEGVIVNLKNDKEALKAYKRLSEVYKEIILEKHIEGNDYRVCVVDGEVVAAALRIPPFVVGDGINNIARLISLLNEDPSRGNGHEKSMTAIKIDELLIDEINTQGYSLESILPMGSTLYLRKNCNLSTGGIAIDCTDDICIENIDICKRAAKTLGINICGIDICCEDISKPMGDRGAIVEINAAPGIRMHHYPYKGESRNVAKAILHMMFKDTPKSIPVISVTGTNGKTTTTRLIGHTLALAGYNVGMTTTGGIYVNNKCIDKGDTTGPESAKTILMNKEIDAAVLETARGGIIRGGLAYDLADVGVITNITNDHLGLDGVDSIEDLAHVKSLVAEAIKADGYAVINADDKVSISILDRIHSNIVMFSKDKDNIYVKNNISKGGIGVYVDNGAIWVEGNNSLHKVIEVKDIAISLMGKLTYNIENSLAACAALIGVGIDCFTISKGLNSFYCDENCNPGRFNIYRLAGVTVVLDYGHNIEGYKAVLEGVKSMKYSRLIGVIGVPGDRSDEVITTIGKISGDNFGYIYIKEDCDRRGRKKGEVAELLRNGVVSSGFNNKNMEIILNEKTAFLKALENSKYGDVIIVFFEEYEPLVDIIKLKIESIVDSSFKQEVMA